ncbi:hypothetical protein AB4349_16245 [Vibrio breoganii]
MSKEKFERTKPHVNVGTIGHVETLPLANNALASRVIFPSVGVIQVSLNLTGLPASLGKQKKKPSH